MTRIPYVIDNRQHTLAEVLNQVLASHEKLAMDVPPRTSTSADTRWCAIRLRVREASGCCWAPSRARARTWG